MIISDPFGIIDKVRGSQSCKRILKGKWLRPADYCATDSLLCATDRALAAPGAKLNINFTHAA